MENNPLKRMGLGRGLLEVARRHPQLLDDMIDRHGKNIAKTLAPDLNREWASDAEFAEFYTPISEWQKLDEASKIEAIEDYFKPVENDTLQVLRFLGGMEAEKSQDEAEALQLKLTDVTKELDKALRLNQKAALKIGNLESRLALFNPDRDLEVSGLVQLVRLACLGRREAGGNVNRLNGYAFFSHTEFRRSTKYVPKPEPPPVLSDSKAIIRADSPPAPGSELIEAIKAAKAKDKPKKPEMLRVPIIIQVKTTLYVVRNDTGLMATTLRLSAPDSKPWENEAEAINSLNPSIKSMRKRGLAGDFRNPTANFNAGPWKFLGHIVGQLDATIGTRKDATSAEGATVTAATAADYLERDLGRTIATPQEIVRRFVFLTVDAVLPGMIEPGDDVPIRIVYRQVQLQNGTYDPPPIPPK